VCGGTGDENGTEPDLAKKATGELFLSCFFLPNFFSFLFLSVLASLVGVLPLGLSLVWA